MTAVIDDTDWRLANCATVGTELFYMQGDPENVRKKVCGHCPLKQKCLDHALDNEEQFGVWGGKSPRERLKMIRQAKGDPEWFWPYWSDVEYLPPICPNKHEVEGSNVFIDYRGHRTCLICYETAYKSRPPRPRSERRKEIA